MTSPSTISASTVVRGNIGGEGSLEILGRVEGNIAMTGQVIIATDAAVKGNITATEIQVAGNVAGNLTASDVVMLNSGARVVGDLAGSWIGIAEGALVRGLVRTDGEPSLVKPAPVAAARPVATPAKVAVAPTRAAFSPPVARPAPAIAPRIVPVQPKVAVAAPVVLEKPVIQEPELIDDEPDSETIPPARHDAPKHERSAEGPPPPVVPAIKGQAKAKKKFKGR